MSYNIASNNSAKAGLCPHGLPASACPVCSGGGGSVKKMDRNTRRHAGEMTWNECYAAWQRMKNQKADKARLMQEQQDIKMQKAAEKMHNIFSKIINLSPVKPLKTVVQNTFGVINKFLTPIKTVISKTASFVKEKFTDISDKIAAMFGEEKLAKMKKAKEFLERGLKKIFSFFGFINKSQEERETSEEVKKEEKKISFLRKLMEKLKFSEDEEK